MERKAYSGLNSRSRALDSFNMAKVSHTLSHGGDSNNNIIYLIYFTWISQEATLTKARDYRGYSPWMTLQIFDQRKSGDRPRDFSLQTDTNSENTIWSGDVADLDDKVAKVKRREDLRYDLHALGIGNHQVILTGDVEILQSQPVSDVYNAIQREGGQHSNRSLRVKFSYANHDSI